MMYGLVQIEDHAISFIAEENGMVSFIVRDLMTHTEEKKTVPMASFFKALAIAVHPEGMPDGDKDYPEAEEAMGKIRWIP